MNIVATGAAACRLRMGHKLAKSSLSHTDSKSYTYKQKQNKPL